MNRTRHFFYQSIFTSGKPGGIITSKGSDERRRFPPPERQTRSLLRTLNHHSASVRPLACGSAAHFTFVKCECGIISQQALLRKSLGAALSRWRANWDIDGFAKISLRASILFHGKINTAIGVDFKPSGGESIACVN